MSYNTNLRLSETYLNFRGIYIYMHFGSKNQIEALSLVVLVLVLLA